MLENAYNRRIRLGIKKAQPFHLQNMMMLYQKGRECPCVQVEFSSDLQLKDCAMYVNHVLCVYLICS